MLIWAAERVSARHQLARKGGRSVYIGGGVLLLILIILLIIFLL
jgi:hypothetical protein